MNRWLSHSLLVFLFSACVAVPADYIVLEHRVVDASPVQSIFIQVDYGELTILGSDETRVTVDGKALFDDELEYVIDSTEEQIRIKVFVHRNSASNIPLQVVVQVPRQMQVEIETNDANVLANDLLGNLEVASTSGDITLENMTGTMTLRSNRGNIAVRESEGIISIAGNYGGLTAQNVHGQIGISTIMGNITLQSLIQGGDTVRLETDHGAVSVNLGADSTLSLQVRSTSGDVACMLPGVATSTRTCEGEIGFDGGSLSVRTVSGAVTLQLIP